MQMSGDTVLLWRMRPIGDVSLPFDRGLPREFLYDPIQQQMIGPCTPPFGQGRRLQQGKPAPLLQQEGGGKRLSFPASNGPDHRLTPALKEETEFFKTFISFIFYVGDTLPILASVEPQGKGQIKIGNVVQRKAGCRSQSPHEPFLIISCKQLIRRIEGKDEIGMSL